MRSNQNGTQRQPVETVGPQAGVIQSDTTAYTRSGETRQRSSETISVPRGAEPSARGGLSVQASPEPLDLIGDRRWGAATAGGAAGHRHTRFEQRRSLIAKLRIGRDEFTQRGTAV